MQLVQITVLITILVLDAPVNLTETVPVATQRTIANGAIILVLAKLEGPMELVATLLLEIHAILIAEQTEIKAVLHAIT
jgi:hypothetical protein